MQEVILCNHSSHMMIGIVAIPLQSLLRPHIVKKQRNRCIRDFSTSIQMILIWELQHISTKGAVENCHNCSGITVILVLLSLQTISLFQCTYCTYWLHALVWYLKCINLCCIFRKDKKWRNCRRVILKVE